MPTANANANAVLKEENPNNTIAPESHPTDATAADIVVQDQPWMECRSQYRNRRTLVALALLLLTTLTAVLGSSRRRGIPTRWLRLSESQPIQPAVEEEGASALFHICRMPATQAQSPSSSDWLALDRLCHTNSDPQPERDWSRMQTVPLCHDPNVAHPANSRKRRRLEPESDNTNTTEEGGSSMYWNILGGFGCVCLSAVASGLLLGLCSLDPLLLAIKERAADTAAERLAAARLLPIVKQHHRLLVTLLLMNAAANEALPLFLEHLVPPLVSLLMSITLVLFFGEILPAAVLTGPNQIQMGGALVPLVRVVLWLLYPIAGPTAALLDWLLPDHDPKPDETSAGGSMPNTGFTRNELSALIRIQHEERLEHHSKWNLLKNITNDSSDENTMDFPSTTVPDSWRQSVSHSIRRDSIRQSLNVLHRPSTTASEQQSLSRLSTNIDNDQRWLDQSIHPSEITWVEGALQMQTKTAQDVYTPLNKVYSIPSTMLLNADAMAEIYATGYSRIPVHEPGHKTRILGILITKQLMLVNPMDARAVSTLTLRNPRCVSPGMTLVDLLNMFQAKDTTKNSRRGGHLALVCGRPSTGERAMAVPGVSLPDAVGLVGIITMEDVLETMLQEQILDEMDRKEQKAFALASKVLKKWKTYVQQKKAGMVDHLRPNAPALRSVVEQAMARPLTIREESVNSESERSSLLASRQGQYS